MKVKNFDISEIHPYENNPRINDYAVEKVAESIQRYGFKVPVVIDKNNVIITGHTRVKACEILGITKIPCVIADDLTEEQVKEFRLVDNKVSEYATWDFEALNLELSDCADLTDFDFPDFSINDDPTEEELDILLEDNIKTSPAKKHEPQIPADTTPAGIPASVIQEDLEDNDDLTVNVVCKDEAQKAELLAYLNEHGFLYGLGEL